MAVGTSVHFGNGAQFRIGPKDQIHPGTRPLDFSGGAVAAFEDIFVIGNGAPLGTKVEQVHEEIIAQYFGLCGEHTMLRVIEVGVQHAEASDQCGHLGGGEFQQLGLVDQHFLCGHAVALLGVVAETISLRLEYGEGVNIGLLGGRICATGREGNRDMVTGTTSGLFDGGATGEDDNVCQGHLLATGLCGVERLLDGFQGIQYLGELCGVVGFPVFLRSEADAGTIGTTALVRPAEGGSGSPCRGHELCNAET